MDDNLEGEREDEVSVGGNESYEKGEKFGEFFDMSVDVLSS